MRSESSGWKGVVDQGPNDRSEWCVAANGKRAWLPEKDLVILGLEGGEEPGKGKVTFERPAGSPEPSDGAPGLELYLLGQRVEEALSRVEKQLDEATLSGAPFFRIVHGKGTGALKRAIAEALDGHPLVKNYYPAETETGGAGVTVVEMAGA
ncbi:MAG: Smr/MutS family protein [Nitrospinota bacterium]